MVWSKQRSWQEVWTSSDWLTNTTWLLSKSNFQAFSESGAKLYVMFIFLVKVTDKSDMAMGWFWF